MAVAKIIELRALNDADLGKRLADLKIELVKLYTQVSTGATLKSPSDVRDTKRSIARILTIKREKELGKLQKAEKKEAKKETGKTKGGEKKA